MRPDEANDIEPEDGTAAGQPTNGEPGNWMMIEAVPESADSPPSDPESFTIPTDPTEYGGMTIEAESEDADAPPSDAKSFVLPIDPDYEYELFAVRPRPDEIPFTEPEYTIAWG